MESYEITKFPWHQIFYHIEGDGPQQSDKSHIETKSTPDFSENIELPLPPGTSGDELFVHVGCKAETLEASNIQPISYDIKSKADSLATNDLMCYPKLPIYCNKLLENKIPNQNEYDSVVSSGNKISDYLNDNVYSPSKVDSDEESQDTLLKPKVLGKEQAKKRLMAFSVTKQSANIAKKQNKTAPAKTKEKPPNPNKGTNFHEQFRATISAIEEEKKKIYRNMPEYLLQEMNELVKGNIVTTPNSKSSNNKNTNSKGKEKFSKHYSTLNKSKEYKRSQINRSPYSSRRRKGGRRSRSRSRSRSNGTRNKSEKRSWSRNRRSRSPVKKFFEEKPIKAMQTKFEKNVPDSIRSKKIFEDWKSFKNSGAAMENDSIISKNELNESESQEIELDNISQDSRSHFKPIFDYLKKGHHKMMFLRAKLAKSNIGKPVLFAEKTIKFTRTKPIIIWSENPFNATDYYMSREVLLENCPSDYVPILRFIFEGKSSESKIDDCQISCVKSRPWYPREKYLQHPSPCSEENTESLPQKPPLKNQEKENDVQSFKKKISLVNEDYLSDEIEEEEITVDGVKVQLDLEMNTVKVRSKWDSDFEDGKNQKESEKDHKIRSGEIRGGKMDKKSEEKLHFLVESRSAEDTNPHPGYLASEYEEFLKMVCFDSKDTQNSQAEKISQYDDVKQEKMEKKKLFKENEKNLNFSIDWDRESEEELKISSEKCQVKENRESEEDLNMSLEKFQIKNYLLKFEKPKKEKTEKLKQKTNIKISSKVKKDTYKNSSSEDSSSSESESDSDTDSDSGESKSSKKNKRRKLNSKRKNFTKEKKKIKKHFSDKSENDLDIGKPKKENTKKIGGSSDNGESPNKLERIDVKKQMMLKKCEEKISKKKGKENEFKKESVEKNKGLKAEKKKEKNKSIKKKKLKKTETDSESNSGENAKKKKKFKKKRSLSISSDSEKEKPKLKTFKHKKTKKGKRKKEMQYSSSSESDENLFSEKWKKKKEENVESSKDFKCNIFVKETNLEAEEKLFERGQKVLKKKNKKFQNGDDDWETSSSSVESERRSENNWDEEIKTTLKVSDIDTVKEKNIDAVKLENEGKEKILAPDNLVSETLKNSLSTFSFNENSFCGFGQELSRDFFLSERNFSNSANIGFCENSGITPIDARPFQCIGKGEEKKAVELYSPGYSDSEISDAEAKSQRSKTDSPDKDVYDPLNCDSESSVDYTEVETSSIPLPTMTEISLSDEAKPQNLGMSPLLKVTNELKKALSPSTPPLKFIGNELITGASLNESSPKMQITNCKNQQILKTKAASVFQDDSDEENKPVKSKEEKHKKTDFELEEKKKSKNGSTERDQKRSHSRERKIKKSLCETVEASRREIRSDSFEIEPLSKGVTDEVVETVQPIPVLLGVSSNRVWSKSLPGYEFSQVPDSLIDQAESFDIYPSEESKYPSENYCHELSLQKLSEKSSRRRKSRSRSLSPRKKRKSKSPIRRRSPKRWSASPKYREKSPRSPRRRISPKRKSPSKRRSKSPSRRKKSRRFSPRRSRSKSPLKKRSPKRWDSSPRRKDSPSRGYSPRRDSHYSNYSDSSYWMSTVETSNKVDDMEVSLQGCSSPQYDNSMSFPIMPAPIISEAQINNSFYDREYGNEYGVNNYMEEMGMNNLITINNHNIEKMESPKRPSLDQRIELELGSPMSASLPFPVASQTGQTFEGADPNHYQTYCCDNSGANENFYQNQTLPDFNGQYFNEVQPSNYDPYSYPLTHPQPPSVQNSVMQLGNVVEVVPTLQHAHLPPPPQPSTPQIMQVGNVLQVVPTQKVPTPVPVPPPVLDLDSLPSSPVIKTQKATAVVAPSSIVPPPNLEAMINPLIKAILSERDKRRKAKEKRRLEREARRKARQLRREAKLMSVSEKLKKSVQNEGLVLGQEVEDEELLDAMDIPSPPVPVQIITVSSPSGASPAAKGILITAGFVSKSPSKKKEVKFADGVFPGEGTSSSGEEDIPLSPPKPKLPKEKPFKKKKIKVKKKVKVHIIKQVLHEEEDDEDEDNLSPPPPPPGDPPPVFFARFPFAGNAQFPVYQTQTTTTATVQYPAPTVL